MEVDLATTTKEPRRLPGLADPARSEKFNPSEAYTRTHGAIVLPLGGLRLARYR
jgi:hypothetical protein